jgi:hypothetical protein
VKNKTSQATGPGNSIQSVKKPLKSHFVSSYANNPYAAENRFKPLKLVKKDACPPVKGTQD